MIVEEKGMDDVPTPAVAVNFNNGQVNTRRGIYEQYHHECLGWLRSIEFFRQENSYLKNRLSEVVDSSSDKVFLAQAEHFQNQFIIKDEFLDELRHDVNEHEKCLDGKILKKDICIDEQTIIIQKKLREQIDYLEKDFTDLRDKFNQYLRISL
jgi:hypothetical protein